MKYREALGPKGFSDAVGQEGREPTGALTETKGREAVVSKLGVALRKSA